MSKDNTSALSNLSTATSDAGQAATGFELLPTETEAEVSLYDAKRGAKYTVNVKDPVLCTECIAAKAKSLNQCAQCNGLGYLHVYRQVDIDLPAGLLEGDEIRYSGLGRYNLCVGKNSDLIVKIKICRHPYLELAGKNITCTLVVSLLEAIMGKKVSVPTLAGKAMVKLHPLTHSGKTYRLKGLGIDGGDQLVNVEVAPGHGSVKLKADAHFLPVKDAFNDNGQQSLSLCNLKPAA